MWAYPGKEKMFREALIREGDMQEGAPELEIAMAAFREFLAEKIRGG